MSRRSRMCISPSRRPTATPCSAFTRRRSPRAAATTARRASVITTPATTPHSSSIPTATTSRPSITDRRSDRRRRSWSPPPSDNAMLWACLSLPSLPLDVFARAQEADTPFVVTTGGHHPRIVAASDAARIAGIRREQPIATALALAPDIIIRERDTAAEEAALADVATMLLAFTPSASLAPPNAVVAEIAGSLRLFGGLAQIDAALRRAARARGYDATLAVAPTPTAALLLARGGCTTPVLDADALSAALAPLPLALLDIDADTLATLEAAGVTTFSGLQALPRAGLARRFDARLVDV